MGIRPDCVPSRKADRNKPEKRFRSDGESSGVTSGRTGRGGTFRPWRHDHVRGMSPRRKKFPRRGAGRFLVTSHPSGGSYDLPLRVARSSCSRALAGRRRGRRVVPPAPAVGGKGGWLARPSPSSRSGRRFLPKGTPTAPGAGGTAETPEVGRINLRESALRCSLAGRTWPGPLPGFCGSGAGASCSTLTWPTSTGSAPPG